MIDLLDLIITFSLMKLVHYVQLIERFCKVKYKMIQFYRTSPVSSLFLDKLFSGHFFIQKLSSYVIM